MTPEERLASIDSNIATLTERLTAHTEQDESNFSRLFDQFTGLDGKLDELIVEEAERKGEAAGFKRSALILAAIVSLAVSIAGVATALYVG